MSSLNKCITETSDFDVEQGNLVIQLDDLNESMIIQTNRNGGKYCQISCGLKLNWQIRFTF